MSSSEQMGRAAHRDDWDTHWDHYAVANEYNPAQSYRRRLALRLLERTAMPERVLDIGSGQGDLLVDAAERWPQAALLGLETSQRGNEIAQAKLPSASFELVDLSRDVAPTPRLAGWATHAVCSEVLEHVDEPAVFLRHARAYLAPGARLVVTVPGGPMSLFDRHIGHRKHYTPGVLRALLESAGFEVEWVGGAGFPFFNLYRLVVIARGKRLVQDVSRRGQAGVSLLARFVMSIFRLLFHFNLAKSPWGWQVIALARNPL
jgi:SAM-dependent methyltransferase